jgi:hypothetical protein
LVDFRISDMLSFGTPVEDHTREFGLWVKREDMSCRLPGPQFSKTRGVYAHLAARPLAGVVGVLDTYHSQAGHAVARACQILGRRCINFYPEYKREPGCRIPQQAARALGAELVGIPAGRSSVIYHQAKKLLKERFPSGYMMPNALKLEETVDETAREVGRLKEDEHYDTVIIPSSSATIAAGVIRGFLTYDLECLPRFIIHLGYSRSESAVRSYLSEKVGCGFQDARITIVDEGYSYKDKARPGPTPPWPCNAYYDLKAFRWWMREHALADGSAVAGFGEILFWNVG